MISLHQLFRVLSRVSVDPAAPFYATSLQSPIAGAPRGPNKGPPSGPSSPVKIPRPVSDSGVLTTCTTTSPAPGGALTPGVPGMQLEETLYEEGDSSSTFPFNSNSSGAVDLEGPPVAAGGPLSAIGSPQKPGGAPAYHTQLSPLCRSSSNHSSSSSSSSTQSTSASSPLLASSSVTSSPSLSACSVMWGGPLPGKVLASPEALLAALAHPGGNHGGPYAAARGPSVGTTAADQLQQLQTRLFGSAAAAGAALSETQEETEIEGPLSRPYRTNGRQRRRLWRHQTPWDSSSTAAAAASAPLLLQKGDTRVQSRRGTFTAAGLALNEEETVATPSSDASHSSRRRSVVASRGQQRSRVSPSSSATAGVSSFPHPLSLPVCVSSSSSSGSGQRQGSAGGLSAEGDNRLLGVCFSPPKDVWRARITVEGKQYEQQFSVKRHGYDGARILATRWRAQMERARTSRPAILP